MKTVRVRAESGLTAIAAVSILVSLYEPRMFLRYYVWPDVGLDPVHVN